MSQRTFKVCARRPPGRFVLMWAACFAFCVGGALTARADTVALYGGSVSVDCTNPSPNGYEVIFNLTGQDFSLHGLISGFSSGPCSPAVPVAMNITSTGSTAYDQLITTLDYQGVHTIFTDGLIQFDGTSISGFVRGFAPNQGPAITNRIDFSGMGVGTTAGRLKTFNVATPEPATLVLFGTGLAAAARVARRGRRRMRENL